MRGRDIAAHEVERLPVFEDETSLDPYRGGRGGQESECRRRSDEQLRGGRARGKAVSCAVADLVGGRHVKRTSHVDARVRAKEDAPRIQEIEVALAEERAQRAK